jgi:hypothetical protein
MALKILAQSFSREADRLHRFEQEARAVAALAYEPEQVPPLTILLHAAAGNPSP